jgi:hypothetical protein
LGPLYREEEENCSNRLRLHYRIKGEEQYKIETKRRLKEEQKKT